MNAKRTTMIASIQDLPHPILYEIACYIHDTAAMCHFAATCRDVHSAVVGLDEVQQHHENNYSSELWKGRHERRWRNRSVSTSKHEFVRRVWIDKQTVTTLEELADATSTQNHLDDIDDDDEDAAYNKRSILMQRRYALDACWNTYRTHSNAKVRKVAFSFLFPLQILSAAEELVKVLNQTYASTPKMFEQYAIMTSKVFTVLGAPVNSSDRCVRNELDGLADSLRAKLQSRRQDCYSPREKIQAVSTLFFQDLRFQLGSDRVEHHTMFFALLERTCSPLVLAILYKCLCHRLGVHVDIVRNQHWTMLRTECAGLYINLYRNGALLTAPQLQDFVEARRNQQNHQRSHRIMPLVSLSAMDVAQCLADDVAVLDDTSTNPNSNTMLCGLYTTRAVLQNPTTMTVDAAELDFCKYGFDE